jgi:hypothetical protein
MGKKKNVVNLHIIAVFPLSIVGVVRCLKEKIIPFVTSGKTLLCYSTLDYACCAILMRCFCVD